MPAVELRHREPKLTVASEIIATLPEGEILQVCLGTHWTAVVVRSAGEVRCGLASTNEQTHDHGPESPIPGAGRLEELPARRLAEWIESDVPLRRSLGAAAINALLPKPPAPWHDLHAAEALARLGEGRSVALVGHFAFASELRSRVRKLWILERNPHPGDEPEESASRILPEADVVALTGATFVNGSLDGLLRLCRPGGRVVVLGPSTPLSPVLFDHGIHVLSGVVVEATEAVVRGVAQGADFHQLRGLGVRRISLTALGVKLE